MSARGVGYHLYVGIPSFGQARNEFSIDSLAGLLWHLGRKHPEIREVAIQRDVRTYRQTARQGIIEGALQWGATHILFLDDDHTFAPGAFDLLWKEATENKIRAIGGLYMTRGLPCAPCIFKITARGTVPIFYYEPDTVVPVDVLGFGFTLFDATLFDAQVGGINPPWFDLGIGFGEDAAFCARLLQSGVQLYVHTGAKIGHIMETPKVITEDDYLLMRDQIDGDAQRGGLVPVGYRVPKGNGGEPKVEPGSWWRKHSRRFWKAQDSGPGSNLAEVSKEELRRVEGASEAAQG